MRLEDGWIVGVERVSSPHFDDRPDGEEPSLLVVHNISLPPGEFGGPYMEGTDTQPFEPEQYRKLAEISALLMKEYPITLQRVTGHSDIAPGRKTDPGPMFFWDDYREMLSHYTKNK